MTRLLIWSAVGQFPDMRECWILVGSSRHPRTLSSLQHLVCQNFQGSCALLQDTPTTMNRSREKRWPQFYFLVSNFTVFGCYCLFQFIVSWCGCYVLHFIWVHRHGTLMNLTCTTDVVDREFHCRLLQPNLFHGLYLFSSIHSLSDITVTDSITLWSTSMADPWTSHDWRWRL